MSRLKGAGKQWTGDAGDSGVANGMRCRQTGSPGGKINIGASTTTDATFESRMCRDDGVDERLGVVESDALRDGVRGAMQKLLQDAGRVCLLVAC
jgi:hypothetical protein